MGYNHDDCLSTYGLRDWLESIRSTLISQGETVDRPVGNAAEPSERLTEWQERIADLVGRLTGDVPADIQERSPDQHARWILAHVLDFHRREDKAAWWEYFRLAALSGEELLEERAGLAGLTFIGEAGGTAEAPIHRYRFPPQETEIRGDEPLRNLGGDKLGAVAGISIEDRTVDIKKRRDTAAIHPEAVFVHNMVDAKVKAQALVRIGTYVAENGLAGIGPYQAARDLLLRQHHGLAGMPFAFLVRRP